MVFNLLCTETLQKALFTVPVVPILFSIWNNDFFFLIPWHPNVLNTWLTNVLWRFLISYLSVENVRCRRVQNTFCYGVDLYRNSSGHTDVFWNGCVEPESRNTILNVCLLLIMRGHCGPGAACFLGRCSKHIFCFWCGFEWDQETLTLCCKIRCVYVLCQLKGCPFLATHLTAWSVSLRLTVYVVDTYSRWS